MTARLAAATVMGLLIWALVAAVTGEAQFSGVIAALAFVFALTGSTKWSWK